MKTSIFLSALALVATSTSKPTPAKDFCQLKLPGGHQVANEQLFEETIQGYNAKYSKYTREEWSNYMLQKCRHDSACTSCLGIAANNSGSTGGYFWFGYTYGGGPITLKNLTRYKGGSDAVGWTISSGGCSS